MKRLDDGKVSLVEFMRSIKFTDGKAPKRRAEYPNLFAGFEPQARPGTQSSAEDSKLVRSAN
jgi:hypothetical protein